VLVPEMNTGQFNTILRDRFLVDAVPLTKTSGQPFAIAELEAAIDKYFDGIEGNEGGEVPANKTQLPQPEQGHDDGSYPDAPFHGDDAALPGEGPEHKAVNQ
jgi:2-oxoglutarate ferredoxin oxidoreductase subunit alpha